MFRVAIPLIACLGCSSSTSTPSGQAGDSGASNVEFAPAMCASPGACGGDPRGTWSIVSGCTPAPCDSAIQTGTGTVSGTYTIGDGGYTFQYDRSLTACGRRRGSGSSTSAPATIMGSRLVFGSGGGVDFCVQGDTLFIIDVNASYPDLVVTKLTRKVEPMDAAP